MYIITCRNPLAPNSELELSRAFKDREVAVAAYKGVTKDLHPKLHSTKIEMYLADGVQ